MTDRSLLAPQVQRYRVRLELSLDGEAQARMTEAALGEWVKYSDVAAALSRLGGPQEPTNGTTQEGRYTCAHCGMPFTVNLNHSECAAGGRREP